MSPIKLHERRLAAIFKTFPSRNCDKDPILTAHIERTFQMDIAAQRKFKDHMKKLPLLIYSAKSSSSGFRMATEIRRFWIEYVSRFGQFGPHSLPSSFNVLEAFVRFDPSCFTFLLRPERDHLLPFSEYLDWYTASSFPEEPKSLIDIMEEGVTYSYDFVVSANEPLLSAEGANLLMAGISLIRHGDEVAVFALAGESPPADPVDPNMVKELPAVRGKEEIQPSDEVTATDRFLEGVHDYSRVLLASRFDLSNKLNDVRYLLRDVGSSYEVATDDFEMLRFALKEGGRTPDEYQEFANGQARRLRRYSDLFSAAAASLFLPAFFIDQSRRIVTSEFLTVMGTEQKSPKVKRLRRELGEGFFRPSALTYCLVGPQQETAHQYRIEPPEMKFQSSGYWKALEPGQVGTSSEGIPIIGKTWVHRTETWESSAPETFIARRAHAAIPDARREHIYVIRCPSHSVDIYKVGLTTRDVGTRIGELTSSTSTPLPFEVLASWPVEDARQVEKEIHELLAPYRLSPRREFFRLPLPDIVKAIESVVSKRN
jgi:hypothetical protein